MVQPTYDERLRQKMSLIYAARMRQSGQTSMGPMDPQGMNQHQPHVTGQITGEMNGMPFGQLDPAQAQANIQARMRQQLAGHTQPMQMPASGPPGANGGLAPVRQPPMHPHMGANQPPMSLGAQPSMPLGPQPQPALQHPVLTQQDQYHINSLAQRMYQASPRERIDAIRATLQNLPPQQQASLRSTNTDPLAAWFRQQATRKYLTDVASQGRPTPGVPPSPRNPPPTPQPGNPPRAGQPPPQTSQIMSGDDYSTFANVHQIQSQQNSALESAKQGHVVVPASDGQAALNQLGRNPSQQNTSAPFGNLQQSQDPAARRPQPQQQYPNRMPQAGRPGQPVGAGYPHAQGQRANLTVPTTANTPNPPAKLAPPTPRQALQGQAGGGGSGQTQPLTGEGPHLNQGVPPNPSPQISSGSHPAMQRPAATGQNQLGGPGPPPTSGAQRPSQQQIMQEQMKRKLASLPNDEERSKFMHDFKQYQLHRLRQQPATASAPRADSRGMMNPQVTNPPPAAPIPPPQQGQNAGLAPNGLLQRPPPHRQFTPDQQRQIDRLHYHPNILGNDNAPRPPKHVVTWGDLKQWASVTPGLPPDAVQKLQRLQIQQVQRMGQATAPTANMVPAPMPTATGLQLPPISTPSEQEIRQSRKGFPTGLPHMSDEQVRRYIVLRKQTHWAHNELRQRRPAQYHAQIQEFGNGIAAELQMLQTMAKQDVAAPASQPPPTLVPPRSQAAPPAAKKTAQTPVPEKKGLKRQSGDDVWEVPDPRGGRHPPSKAVSTPLPTKRTGPPDQQPPPNQPRNDASDGRTQQDGAATHGVEQSRDLTHQADPESIRKYQAIRDEVAASMPIRKPINLVPQEKAAIEQSIDRLKPMVMRLQPALIFGLKMINDVERIKTIYRNTLILLSQFRNNNPRHPYNDQFTINLAECQSLLTTVGQFMKECMPKPQMPPQPKSGKQQPLLGKETTPELSASNLQQQQILLQSERQADFKKNHSTNRAPAAPTSAQSPFSFNPSPDKTGYIGDHPVTKDTLYIPEKKKRKPNGSTAPSPSLPIKKSPPAPKKKTDAAKSKAAPPVLRCPVKGCVTTSFADAAALQTHQADNHTSVPIADPLAFSLGRMRNALGLDEQGQMKGKQPDAVSKPETPAMKASSSTQGSTVAKPEPSSAAMSRVVSQASASPLGKTLGLPKGAVSGTFTMHDPPRSSAPAAPPSSNPATATGVKDAWSNSAFEPLIICASFDALREPLGLGLPWDGAGEDPDLTSDSGSPSNSITASKPTPSPRLSNRGEDPNLGVHSIGGLVLGDPKAFDMGDLMNLEGYGDYLSLPGDQDLERQLQDGDGMVPFSQWIQGFGMTVDDLNADEMKV